MKRPVVVGIVCGGLAGTVYAATMYTGVPGGDAGELVAAVATGGVPHPPGYPLYALVTKPFLLLPFGSVAARANFASAATGAAAVGVLAFTMMRLTGRWWGAVVAAGAFACSPLVWLYATSAEVFSLNNLLIAIELALLLMVDQAPRTTPQDRRRLDRLICTAAFIASLAIANHHTSVLTSGVVLVAVWWRTRDAVVWRHWRGWLTLAGCAVTGLAPYLALPLFAHADAAVSWGDTGTLSGFVSHFFRRDYGTFDLKIQSASVPMPLAAQLEYYLRDLIRQISWLGVLLATWGLYRGLADRRTRFVAATSLVAWAAYLLVLHSLATLPLDQPLMHGVAARFWQQPLILVCLWIGLGFSGIPRVPARGLAAIALVIVGAHGTRHWRESNHRGDFRVEDYGRAILASLPPNALVLMRGDLVTNSTRYLQAVEGLRPDVRLLDQELLTYRWYVSQVRHHTPDVALPGSHYTVNEPGGFVARQVVDANIGARPIVICGSGKPGDTSLDSVYRRWPLGLCDRLRPAEEALESEVWEVESDRAQPYFRNGVAPVPPVDSWEHVAWAEVWEARHRPALLLLMDAIERSGDPAALRKAAARFDAIAREHPEPPPHVFKNQGLAWARLVDHDPAAAARAVQAWRVYLLRGPTGDRDRAAIVQAVADMSK